MSKISNNFFPAHTFFLLSILKLSLCFSKIFKFPVFSPLWNYFSPFSLWSGNRARVLIFYSSVCFKFFTALFVLLEVRKCDQPLRVLIFYCSSHFAVLAWVFCFSLRKCDQLQRVRVLIFESLLTLQIWPEFSPPLSSRAPFWGWNCPASWECHSYGVSGPPFSLCVFCSNPKIQYKNRYGYVLWRTTQFLVNLLAQILINNSIIGQNAKSYKTVFWWIQVGIFISWALKQSYTMLTLTHTVGSLRHAFTF